MSRILQIWNRLHKYFNEKCWHFITSNLNYLLICDVKDSSISVLQEGPSYLIHKERSRRSTLIFDICSKHGNCRCTSAISCLCKGSQGTYLKISSEKKAKIGQRAAEHGVLVTVWYYATKVPVRLLPVPRVYARPAGNSLIVGVAYLSSIIISELISTKFQQNFQNQLFAKI